jgi:hypothetical protein
MLAVEQRDSRDKSGSPKQPLASTFRGISVDKQGHLTIALHRAP